MGSPAYFCPHGPAPSKRSTSERFFFFGDPAPAEVAAGRRGGHVVPMSATPITIYVDADACPVKAEIYRVAGRHGAKTYVVANSFLMVPNDPLVERVIVGSGFDAADD